MPSYSKSAWEGKRLWIGIDVHLRAWHVTVLAQDGLRLFSNSIPAGWPSLKKLLKHYAGAEMMTAAYEAGYFGYELYDKLIAHGCTAVVTPPNKIPTAAGDRVKTNKIDSHHLAEYLRAGILKAVHVPSPEERAHREVSRRRRKLIGDRVRIQARIKSFLRFHGLELSVECRGKWSRAFVSNLWQVRLSDPYLQQSFHHLLEEFEAITGLVDKQTHLLRDLSRCERYAHQVDLLMSIPGVGWLTAIEVILEVRDFGRFRKADRLGAYVGLTPSQHSTGDHVRFGRITKQGLPNVRALLVEASWVLIRKDPAMREKYDAIKQRAGGKRAIVGIARRLVTRMRRLILDNVPYQIGVIA